MFGQNVRPLAIARAKRGLEPLVATTRGLLPLPQRKALGPPKEKGCHREGHAWVGATGGHTPGPSTRGRPAFEEEGLPKGMRGVGSEGQGLLLRPAMTGIGAEPVVG